ncbi:hypothetical protein [Halogeometricum luteum]|uniref:Uncharacterized protein n=1 Tax=Halogeometricum luteum TaxID=2950537 RepID=A0ABU2G2J3_9EURY|nr:hypothetical protein [Halogeometricum sp. S3BR5-2]MDS0294989.1 hypothetical protein [Halogeometricum sp. S3BR5-2]
MSQALPEEWFVVDDRANAAVAWILTAVIAAVGVGNLLTGGIIVAAFAVVTTFVAATPALVHRSWTKTVPWLMLLLASLPLLVGTYDRQILGDAVFALSIGMLALLVVVALQMTTTVRMTPNFAIGFVMITTMGTAGVWALGSAASARYLGTAFVETNQELMGVFSVVLVVSVVSAVAFRWYFRRQLEANLDGDSSPGVKTT